MVSVVKSGQSSVTAIISIHGGSGGWETYFWKEHSLVQVLTPELNYWVKCPMGYGGMSGQSASSFSGLYLQHFYSRASKELQNMLQANFAPRSSAYDPVPLSEYAEISIFYTRFAQLSSTSEFSMYCYALNYSFKLHKYFMSI